MEPVLLHCPHCIGDLALAQVGDLTARECTRCGGIWVDSATLDALHAGRTPANGALARPATAAAQVQGLEHARRCPVCATLMARLEYGRESGVVVDVCGKHGTWFDADELQHVVRFMQQRAASLPDLGDPAQWRAARARLEEDTAAAAARLPRPSRLAFARDLAGDVFYFLSFDHRW
jgi:Zn-finger nucleic acid-binding protein